MATRRSSRFVFRLPAVLLALSAAAAPLFAQVAPGVPEASNAALESSSRQWLDGEIARGGQAAPGMPLRMEVSVGQLDSRLRLAARAKVEPYIPAGMRLWGKTRLGLRCVDGPVRWNVFLPIQVKAFGPAWVVRGPVQSGTTLGAADAMQAKVDWAEEPMAVLGDPAQWVGATVVRNLNAGQALRVSMVRAAQVFDAGSNVRVVAEGPGYSVTSDGQAVGAGIVGQTVRVRMEGGRFMTGTVVDSRTVRVAI